MGWQTMLAAGSLGRQGEEMNAGSFFSGLEVHPVDYSPPLELPDPLAALLPFQLSGAALGTGTRPVGASRT